jgi:hypothetical protein
MTQKGCERLKFFWRSLNKEIHTEILSRPTKCHDTCVSRTDSHTNFIVLQHTTPYARIKPMKCVFSPQELCWVKGLDIDGLREYYKLVNKANLVHNLFLVYLLLSMFINLYMYWATMCPSSGETTVFMRCGWLSGKRTLQSSTSLNTVVSTDDGHIVARNM